MQCESWVGARSTIVFAVSIHATKDQRRIEGCLREEFPRSMGFGWAMRICRDLSMWAFEGLPRRGVDANIEAMGRGDHREEGE